MYHPNNQVIFHLSPNYLITQKVQITSLDRHVSKVSLCRKMSNDLVKPELHEDNSLKSEVVPDVKQKAGTLVELLVRENTWRGNVRNEKMKREILR